MEKRCFVCGEVQYGKRIDKEMGERFDDLSRSYVKKLIEEGCVSVNGKAVKASERLKAGDEVELILPTPEMPEAQPENIALDIIFEDESLLVINKPAGMVVHPAVGNLSGTLVNALLFHCGASLSSINGVMRPGIVHRLDKDTTGLLVAAKGDKAHEILSHQLADRTLKRRYKAIVHNNITEDSGRLQTQIARSGADRKKMTVVKEGGREAATNYTVLERFGKYTYVCCALETGRTHQIRVHMKHMGNPIVGDKAYGVKNEEFNLKGQLLHAGEIGFVHPVTGEYMEFTAPEPEPFEKILKTLRQRKNQIF